MSAQILDRPESGFTLQITIPYNHSMLDFEENLQQRLNEAGVLATQEGLRQFDTDGSPITVGSLKLTTKGQLPKEYQTPYGVATIARHVYPSSQGGGTYCPLDHDARSIVSSTPKFAQMVASKYAEFGSARVQHDPRGVRSRSSATRASGTSRARAWFQSAGPSSTIAPGRTATITSSAPIRR